jgi:hypothetical protein
MSLTVRNWGKFQHYKGRRPPWIKLHRELLEDRSFLSLPLASQALAPRLWLLASESEDGSLSSDPAELAFRMRCSESDIVTAVNALIKSGFLSGSLDSASVELAACEQGAILDTEESRVRVEERTETDSSPSAPEPLPNPLHVTAQGVLDEWSKRTGTKLRVEASINSILKRIRSRLKEGFTAADLLVCVEFAKLDPFYSEKGYSKDPHVLWRDASRVEDLLRRAEKIPPVPMSIQRPLPPLEGPMARAKREADEADARDALLAQKANTH